MTTLNATNQSTKPTELQPNRLHKVKSGEDRHKHDHGAPKHLAAITRSGLYFAVASVHGYDAARASARMAVALARKADAAR